MDLNDKKSNFPDLHLSDVSKYNIIVNYPFNFKNNNVLLRTILLNKLKSIMLNKFGILKTQNLLKSKKRNT